MTGHITKPPWMSTDTWEGVRSKKKIGKDKPTGKLLFLGRANIESIGIAPAELITALEESFRAKARGQAELSPKPTINPTTDCFLRALPAAHWAFIPGISLDLRPWSTD